MADACMRTPEAAKYVALAESTLTKMRLTGDGPLFVKWGRVPLPIARRTWMPGSRLASADQPQTSRLAKATSQNAPMADVKAPQTMVQIERRERKRYAADMRT